MPTSAILAASDSSGIGFVMIIGFLIVALVYFIPTIIAFTKNRTNKVSILCMNLFLGWLFIGWVIALIWATKEEDKATVININQNPDNYNKQ